MDVILFASMATLYLACSEKRSPGCERIRDTLCLLGLGFLAKTLTQPDVLTGLQSVGVLFQDYENQDYT